MTITDVARLAQEADARYQQIEVEIPALKIGAEEIRIEGEPFSFSAEARERVYSIVTAPATFMRPLSPRLQAEILTEVFHRDTWGNRLSVALCGAEVFSIFRGGLGRLGQFDVVTAVSEALGDDVHSLSVTRIVSNADQLDVDLATPRKSVDVRTGDTVRGGFHISHSIFGKQATSIEMFTHRLVCLNGMIHRDCPSQSGASRTRKLPANHPNGRELQMEQVRRLTAQAWEQLEPVLAELKATQERKADVENVLTGWLQRARISTEAMLPRLKEAWQQDGGENTQYAAINALTRVATHREDVSVRQRRTLASLAGLLAFSNVHICPRCFTVLSQNTTDGADS